MKTSVLEKAIIQWKISLLLLIYPACNSITRSQWHYSNKGNKTSIQALTSRLNPVTESMEGSCILLLYTTEYPLYSSPQYF
ncbi:hypothetical protein CS542_02670 [Pedobacter sp. IW39]|nr:hypothetical protein CS542_02670 [Pedobacter sp. IW39]